MKKLRIQIKLLLIIILLSNISFASSEIKEETGKFIYGRNMLEVKDSKIDINGTSKEKMLASGISTGYVNKIIEYREITGGFKDLKELRRISGIGEKTYEKIVLRFKIESEPQKVDLKINLADAKTLMYFGLDKKEIKAIIDKREKKEYITHNMDLKNILLTDKKYDELKDKTDYQIVDF